MAAFLPCGKWRGRPLADVPTGYLRWAVGGMDTLDPWTRDAVRQELRRRGARFLPAAVVLDDLEEILTERVSEDPALPHAAAGLVSDHVLSAFEELRQRHEIGQETELVVAPRRTEETHDRF
jgi:hypothetical protein